MYAIYLYNFIIYFFISACVSSETVTTLNNPKGQKMAFDPEGAADTRIKLALVYIENEQMQQAKENLDKALSYQPDSAKVHRIFAYYYEKVQENKKAEEFYKEAISLDASNGDTYHNYGTFLCGQARYDEADAAFLKAISAPKYTRVARTYANAAICSEKAGFNEKAIFYYQYALAHSPKSNEINLSLAKLNITEKNYKEAILNLFSFQKASDATAESLWQWIRLSYATGKENSLERYSEQLLTQFPESQQALDYLTNKHHNI
ncbi:type IV pilus biogenesis/stability protein PilW [Psychromonas sp. GE-S-Ul-11]|uniref:type IV pilus biogenesis/stability protein PilW n=1 Tax=Psychromonas sp. GE-S-Ul-11 TaxID=3241170 RepID=UPI003AAC30E5